MSEATVDDALIDFRQALKLASENLAVEALAAFEGLVEKWPAHDLADDALFNAGACYLALNQFKRAEDTFLAVIERYPDATISEDWSSSGLSSSSRSSGPFRSRTSAIWLREMLTTASRNSWPSSSMN